MLLLYNEKQTDNFTINPTCTSCGENYNIERHELGYHTCLSCGSEKILIP